MNLIRPFGGPARLLLAEVNSKIRAVVAGCRSLSTQTMEGKAEKTVGVYCLKGTRLLGGVFCPTGT